MLDAGVRVPVDVWTGGAAVSAKETTPPPEKRPAAVCSQCGKDCGRKRLCRLRLAAKYIAFLIDRELEKLERLT